MKKTVRTIATYIFAVVLAVFCLFTVSAESFLSARAESRAAELTGLLDKTSIENDLKELDLSGYSAADGLQLVYFGEVGYREANSKDYGIYFYIYNPEETAFNTSGNNTVNMAVGFNAEGEPDEYANLSLTFIDSTDDHRYYKFRLADAEQMYEYAKSYSQQRGSRRYDIAGIQLLASGESLPHDYATPATYTYTGYAKGYGEDVFADSTLECVQTERKVIQFDDVQQTYYRYPQDTENFAEIKTVYFSIPNDVLDYYGGIYSIQAEYYEYDLQPVMVVESDDVYNEFEQYIGETIPRNNDLGYCFYVSETMERGPGILNAAFIEWYYGNYIHAMLNNSNLYSEQLDKIVLLFNAPGSVDDYTVSRNALLAAMEEYTEKFGQGKAYGGFNDDLFQTDSTGYNGATYIDISGDDLFDLEGFDTGNVLENWLWALFQGYDNPPIQDIEPIYPVQAGDLNQSDISNELYIAPQDEADFITYCEEQMEQDRTVYMFRYKVDDYVDKQAWIRYTGSGIGPVFDEEASARYVTVDLGFDIISLGFQTDKGLTIVPVVSDPINVIPDLEPGDEILDNTNGVPWLTIALLLACSVAGVIITTIIERSAKKAPKSRTGGSSSGSRKRSTIRRTTKRKTTTKQSKR